MSVTNTYEKDFEQFVLDYQRLALNAGIKKKIISSHIDLHPQLSIAFNALKDRNIELTKAYLTGSIEAKVISLFVKRSRDLCDLRDGRKQFFEDLIAFPSQSPTVILSALRKTDKEDLEKCIDYETLRKYIEYGLENNSLEIIQVLVEAFDPFYNKSGKKGMNDVNNIINNECFKNDNEAFLDSNLEIEIFDLISNKDKLYKIILNQKIIPKVLLFISNNFSKNESICTHLFSLIALDIHNTQNYTFYSALVKSFPKTHSTWLFNELPLDTNLLGYLNSDAPGVKDITSPEEIATHLGLELDSKLALIFALNLRNDYSPLSESCIKYVVDHHLTTNFKDVLNSPYLLIRILNYKTVEDIKLLINQNQVIDPYFILCTAINHEITLSESDITKILSLDFSQNNLIHFLSEYSNRRMTSDEILTLIYSKLDENGKLLLFQNIEMLSQKIFIRCANYKKEKLLKQLIDDIILYTDNLKFEDAIKSFFLPSRVTDGALCFLTDLSMDCIDYVFDKLSNTSHILPFLRSYKICERLADSKRDDSEQIYRNILGKISYDMWLQLFKSSVNNPLLYFIDNNHLNFLEISLDIVGSQDAVSILTESNIIMGNESDTVITSILKYVIDSHKNEALTTILKSVTMATRLGFGSNVSFNRNYKCVLDYILSLGKSHFDVLKTFWAAFSKLEQIEITFQNLRIMEYCILNYDKEIMELFCKSYEPLALPSRAIASCHSALSRGNLEALFVISQYLDENSKTSLNKKIRKEMKSLVIHSSPSFYDKKSLANFFTYALNTVVSLDDPLLGFIANFLNAVPNKKVHFLVCPEFTAFIRKCLQLCISKEVSIWIPTFMKQMHLTNRFVMGLAIASALLNEVEDRSSIRFYVRTNLRSSVGKDTQKKLVTDLVHFTSLSLSLFPPDSEEDLLLTNSYFELVNLLLAKAYNQNIKLHPFYKEFNSLSGALCIIACLFQAFLPSKFQTEETKNELIQLFNEGPSTELLLQLLSKIHSKKDIPKFLTLLLSPYTNSDYRVLLLPVDDLDGFVDYVKSTGESTFPQILEKLILIPECKERIYASLNKRLLSEGSARSHQQLALLIIKNLTLLGLKEEDQLAQLAEGMRRASSPLIRSKEICSYRILKKLRRKVPNEPLLEPVKRVELIDNQKVYLDLLHYREIAENGHYTIKDLPEGIHEKTLDELFEQLKTRIEYLPDPEKKMAEQYIASTSTGNTLETLWKNMKSSFFNALLSESPDENGVINESKFHLFVSLRHILDLKKDQHTEVFTRSEKTFLSMVRELLALEGSFKDKISAYCRDFKEEETDDGTSISEHTFFEKYWSAIKIKIANAPKPIQNQIEKYFNQLKMPLDTFNAAVEDKLLNALKSAFTDSTLASYLNTMVKLIKENEEVLTPDENALIAMSVSIQACLHGQKGGLKDYYETLPARYKRGMGSDPKELLGYVVHFTDNAVAGSLNELLGKVSLLKDLGVTEKYYLDQTSHQRFYLKNRLHRQFGIKDYKLQFDSYGYLISNKLITKKTPELFRICQKHYTVDLVIDTLVNESIKTLAEPKNDLYQGILATFGKEDKRKVEDMAQDYFEFDEYFTPIKLTRKAALKLLMHRGYVKSDS